jgi:hypothetical protein
MKSIFLTTVGSVTVGVIALLIITSSPEQDNMPVEAPAPVGKVRARHAAQPPRTFTAPSQDIVATPLPATLDPHEQLLDTLYEAPSIPDRLAAARQIGALNNDTGMTDLAMFIAATEATGDNTLLPLAEQVASILGQMRGPGVQALATELAYSASPLVAEAAVNAAVNSEPEQALQQFGVAMLPNPADQQQLDEAIERLCESESNE